MMTFIGLVLAVCACACSAQDDGPPTVDELDVPLYIGRWYQAYGSPFVIQGIQRDGVCVGATYGVYNESTLTVYNFMRLVTPDGEVSDISGYAYTTDDPGKLIVSLVGGSGAGNYWVMQLGPVNEYDGVEQYSYSLVSEQSRLSLFVLVRDVQEFQDLYEEEVLAWLADNGFDTPVNNPLPVYQGEDCLYPDEEVVVEEEEKREIPVVDELDLPLYLGRWYTPFVSAFVASSELRNRYCVTADYGVYNESTITVYNNGLIGAPDGIASDVSGVAYLTSETGKLIVDFGFGFTGDYWVMQLGPPTDYSGEVLYAYALVSEPSARNLYVLARDADEFKELYEEDVLVWLAEQGFDSDTNRPVPLYLGDDCLYPDVPEVQAVKEEDSIPVVDELELELYLGRWFTMLVSPFVFATELNNSTCVTADYGVYNESTITVYNHGRLGVPDGEVSDINGYAYLTEEAGKLLVDFGFGFYGSYWVMQLGPPTDYNGEVLYAYSLVSEPNQRNLYVLARDPEEFRELYEEDVLTFLSDIGYDKPTNRPLPIYQEDECLYAELPEQ